MQTFPICKINLGLNVVAQRPDGYHDLETVFYPVPLCDTLTVEPAASTTLSLEGIAVEGPTEDNIVVRAYRLLSADFPLPPLSISLRKAIPTQAGMGGGSADGAFMLRLLNSSFGLGLSEARLMDYALRLGADCPFFILSKPAYAEGVGERLQPIGLDLSGWQLAVVRPAIPVSTREAFSLIVPRRPRECCKDIVAMPVEQWRDRLCNDFETSVFALHPEIGAIKERLYGLGATYAAMSGSGSAVFGLFPAGSRIAEKEELKSLGDFAWVATL